MGRVRRQGGVYAVRRGRQPGIYEEWSDCQEQTDGFSGAQFRWFPNRQAAEKYLGQPRRRESKRDSEASPAARQESAPWEATFKWEWIIIAAETPLAIAGLTWIVWLIFRA